MSELRKLLNYHIASPEKKEELIKTISNSQVRKLLLSEDITSTTLIQEEVYKTVLEGAEPKGVMRGILPVLKMDRQDMRYVMGSVGTYAEVVAEGAEIPIENQSYTKATFESKKVGTRPIITTELVEDALFDIIELELKKAGQRVENKLNRDAINELIANVSGDVSFTNTSTDLAVSTVRDAITAVQEANREPDTLIMTPGFQGYLMKDSNLAFANRAGTDDVIKTGGFPGTILGLKPYVLSVTTANGSWAYNQSAIGALVLDSMTAGAIGMRRDLTVDQYDDPIRDLVGIAVTMRYDVKTLDGAGMAKICRL